VSSATRVALSAVGIDLTALSVLGGAIGVGVGTMKLNHRGACL
jgi:small-conductance mechanosensitive channel